MIEMRTGKAVVAGDVTIIPLEKVTQYSGSDKSSVRAYIAIEPIGIVIYAPHERQAIDIDGKPMSLAACIQEIDGLEEVLNRLDSP